MFEFWHDFKNDSFTFTWTVLAVAGMVFAIYAINSAPVSSSCTVVIDQ